jgi:hypothetical protein
VTAYGLSEAIILCDRFAFVPARQVMSLIEHHKIPFGTREQPVKMWRPLELIYRADHVAMTLPCGCSVSDEITTDNLEIHPETVIKFLLPIPGQTSWTDDQNTIYLRSSHEFTDDHPRFYGLAKSDFIRD